MDVETKLAVNAVLSPDFYKRACPVYLWAERLLSPADFAASINVEPLDAFEFPLDAYAVAWDKGPSTIGGEVNCRFAVPKLERRWRTVREHYNYKSCG